MPIFCHNALTVDLEDWYHVCGLDREPVIPPAQWRVRANVEKILALLARHDTRATFFVLGSIAEADPSLVPLIAADDHEVASHGYSHRLVTGLTPAEFRDEIRRTGDILASQSGRRPVGFRAPQWSLRPEMTWAFAILAEEGYRYDSSCTPLPVVGDPHGPRTPFTIAAGERRLWEIPPLVTPTWFGNWPTGGGWGFRFFPRVMVTGTLEKLNRAGAPAVLYTHPREVDPDGPRLPLPLLKSFATYGPRRDASVRLVHLLKRYRFGTLEEMIATWEPA